MPTEDDYAREVVRSVGDMMRLLEQARQDITRATLPLFPRITGIERRLDDEAKDRPTRQAELDKTLSTISERLANQDKALSEQDKTLAAQDKVLVEISAWQRWRALIEVALIVVIALYLAFHGAR